MTGFGHICDHGRQSGRVQPAGRMPRQIQGTKRLRRGCSRFRSLARPGKGAMSMENAVRAAAGDSSQIVVAGAGYAGLHVALRLTARLRRNPLVRLTLVDRHDYHLALTELPRVAGGTRAADAVRIPLQDMLAKRVRFVQTEINGFDWAGRQLRTTAGPLSWDRLVLALGSRPNDFAIPGLAERALSLYSASDAERVWAAVTKAVTAAAAAT